MCTPWGLSQWLYHIADWIRGYQQSSSSPWVLASLQRRSESTLLHLRFLRRLFSACSLANMFSVRAIYHSPPLLSLIWYRQYILLPDTFIFLALSFLLTQRMWLMNLYRARLSWIETNNSLRRFFHLNAQFSRTQVTPIAWAGGIHRESPILAASHKNLSRFELLEPSFSGIYGYSGVYFLLALCYVRANILMQFVITCLDIASRATQSDASPNFIPCYLGKNTPFPRFIIIYCESCSAN